MGAHWSRPSSKKPTFTEADVGLQDGKVFLITGGTSGIGLALAKMLYRKGGRVYITGRSPEKGRKAIKAIRKAAAAAKEPTTTTVGGSIEFLLLHLDDLNSVRAAAEEFASRECQLHVLWNNAGVMRPPAGSLSAQGFELQLATNCLGPYLLAQLLKVLLIKTANSNAAAAGPGSVRVVWSSSRDAAVESPPQGVVMDEVRAPPTTPKTPKDGKKARRRGYVVSKTGNMFMASEFARAFSYRHGVVSASVDPGPAGGTRLYRHARCFFPIRRLAQGLLLLPGPERAAGALLYAGLSADVTVANSGCHVVPGPPPRIEEHLRPDLVEAMLPREDGGSGRAEEFCEFCREVTHGYRDGDPGPNKRPF
ncbi:NAD(P)-binding protein [Hypoxylon rubiginosum]|uniref:NAD(P)-binding protein n=1 Tax=Hypoxylon rubiginosum TaxID=110542 RepID=A0ACB9ZFH7_9PEZI|nr:NAD(P)-binding protein [Hypoxylon rubiginosum]